MLVGAKFMTEMHLWQPGVTYSTKNHLLKANKKKIKAKGTFGIQGTFIKTN